MRVICRDACCPCHRRFSRLQTGQTHTKKIPSHVLLSYVDFLQIEAWSICINNLLGSETHRIQGLALHKYCACLQLCTEPPIQHECSLTRTRMTTYSHWWRVRGERYFLMLHNSTASLDKLWGSFAHAYKAFGVLELYRSLEGPHGRSRDCFLLNIHRGYWSGLEWSPGPRRTSLCENRVSQPPDPG